MINKETLSLTTTVQAMVGGTDAVQGIGQDYLLTFGTVYNTLSFNQGDLLTLIFTDQATGYETQIGAGYASGRQFNFVVTYDDKVYGLSEDRVYCCAVDQPTVWNDPNATGNGYVQLSNWYSSSEPLVAMAPFQGKLAFFSRNTCQIWQIDPDLDNWQRLQTLENTGTFAALTVQGLGNLDNIFLEDSGFRSLRVRYADLNGTSDDLGSPIDSLVTELLLTLNDNQKATCCGIIEPISKRYWGFIPNAQGTSGYIYVLSFFPKNKIIAWSRYIPTYETTLASAGNSYSGGPPPGYSGLTIGATYRWIPGATEISLTCNAVVMTKATQFVAGATTATVIGGPTGPFGGLLVQVTNFVPTKFVIFKGQVWATDGSNYYQYGGTDNNTFDHTQAEIQIPFYDEKRPGHSKFALGIDVDIDDTCAWEVYGSPDWINNTWQDVGPAGIATFDNGVVGYEDKGTHFSFKLVSALVAEPAAVTSIIFKYNLAEEVN